MVKSAVLFQQLAHVRSVDYGTELQWHTALGKSQHGRKVGNCGKRAIKKISQGMTANTGEEVGSCLATHIFHYNSVGKILSNAGCLDATS